MTVTARSRRVPLTGAALAAAALLAAGCGSSSSSGSAGSAPASATGAQGSASGAPSGGAASSAGPAPTASSAAAPSSGAGAPGAAAGTSAPGTPGCSTAHLRASIGGGEGAAGSVYDTIVFTNTGGSRCTLYGYPGVSLANSGGPIGAPATRDRSQSPSVVTLAPGAKASAVLRVVNAQNYPSSTCKPDSSSFLLIYPPNQTQAIDVPYKSMGCQNSSVKVLTIRPVAPGAGG